jgi:hypothetical protein
MKAVIILKCEGLKIDGFRFCSGVENIVLDLESIERTEGYLSIIEYLDKVSKIFDSPCFKPHIIANTICRLQDAGYIDEKMNRCFSRYFTLHRDCGLIMEARLKEDEKV